MKTDTVKVLEECSTGCKMALNSLLQLKEHASSASLKQLIKQTIRSHRDFIKQADDMLVSCGEKKKYPSTPAITMSYTMAEMKMMMHRDDSQIAKLLMDGCNMGIQSISSIVNSCPAASTDSIAIANSIVKSETDFMRDLKVYR